MCLLLGGIYWGISGNLLMVLATDDLACDLLRNPVMNAFSIEGMCL